MGIFSSIMTKDVGETSLFYTDRINEYQYGDNENRVEVIYTEDKENNKETLTMNKLPEGRRKVRNDFVEVVPNHNKTLSKMWNFVCRNDKQTVLELTRSGVEPRPLRSMCLVSSKLVVAKVNGADVIYKVHELTDDDGNIAIYRVVATGDTIITAEIDYFTAMVDVDFDKDEMVIDLPKSMAISKNEIELFNFLNGIATNKGYSEVSIRGYLY